LLVFTLAKRHSESLNAVHRGDVAAVAVRAFVVVFVLFKKGNRVVGQFGKIPNTRKVLKIQQYSLVEF
jgi:hypothetical protein